MRPSVFFIGLALTIAGISFSSRLALADQTVWPKTWQANGYSLTAYEPQADAWQNYSKLTGKVAVAVTKPGSDKPLLGVVHLTADTTTDSNTNLVRISNVQIASVNFPNLSADEQKRLDTYLRQNAKLNDATVAVETILLNIKATQSGEREAQIITTAPTIYYSQKPAILVTFDGDPLFGPVKGVQGDLNFAVNTNWNIFKTGSQYYLLVSNFWLTASAPQGPWSPAASVLAILKQLPDDESWKDVRAALNAAPIGASQLPMVWVSTQPAEAIVTDGAPKLVAIVGTQLVYIDNTDATVVFDKASKRYYYLTSGRWYSASTLNGPWSFASEKLPAEFKKIPADSQLGFVLASVPGTPQSQEAIVRAQVPTEAKVDRATASLTVSYAGDPQFQPIKDTAIQYAVNTDVDVIKTSDGKYYACKDAVWFVATTPTGPWTVADNIPDEIYTIPTESKVYNDTYVHEVKADTSSVWFAFTAGYLWAYPWHHGYYYGPGWWYRPWYGYWGGYPVYYPWPRTYWGGMYYNPVTGRYGSAWGVRGPYGGATIGRGYNPASGGYWRGGAIYGPYGGIGRVGVYNPATGNYYHGWAAWGPNGIVTKGSGNWPVPTPYGSRSDVYNRWGNNVAQRPTINQPSTLPATRPGGNVGTKPGGGNVSTLPAGNKPGTLPAGGTKPGTLPAGGTKPGTLPAGGANLNNRVGNIYAGNDGNVYRPTSDGNWSRYNNQNGGWQNVKPATNAPAVNPAAAYRPQPQAVNPQTVQNLNAANAARVQGAANFSRPAGARPAGGIRGR
jgi:hypothetical protein